MIQDLHFFLLILFIYIVSVCLKVIPKETIGYVTRIYCFVFVEHSVCYEPVPVLINVCILWYIIVDGNIV